MRTIEENMTQQEMYRLKQEVDAKVKEWKKKVMKKLEEEKKKRAEAKEEDE